MKNILSEVEINGNVGIGLQIKIHIDGDEVYYEKANSLTLSFLTLLSACFSDGSRFEGNTLATGIRYVTDSGVRGLLFDDNVSPTESDTYQNEGSGVRAISGSTVRVDTHHLFSTQINAFKSIKYLWLVSTVDSGENPNTGVYEVSSVDDQSAAGSTTISAGTTTSVTDFKLVDSNADFVSDGVAPGDWIDNTSGGTTALVTAVDSATQLSLNTDIMSSGQTYNIYRGGEYLEFTLTEALPDDTDIGGLAWYPLVMIWPGDIFSDAFQILDIRIGSSNTAVKIDDVLPIQDLRGRFTNPAHTVDQPVIAASSSKIAITKAFTNNSGSSQTVREVGLLTLINVGTSDLTIGRDGTTVDCTYEGFGVPIARDVITDKVVADGETITVTYEFTVSEDGQKGVLSNFNELMYRQMAQTTRTVEDYFNDNRSQGQSEYTFSLHAGDEEYGDEDMSFAGIQLGTHDSNTVDIDDRNLNDGAGNDTRIPHGEEDDQLYYYGSRVKGWTRASDSEAYLDIIGIFENRGSTSVDVNECGFNVLTNDNNNDPYPVLISRHILDVGDRQTLAAGEFLKVTYRFKITTS